jgi:sugar transferase (PEP-CTERM system associated)
MLFLNALLPAAWFSISTYALTCVGACAFVVASRFVLERSRGEALFRRRVLVLGVGREAARIDARMRRDADRVGFEVVGYVSTGERDQLAARNRTPRYALDSQTLAELCARVSADEIVIAQDDRRGSGASGSMPIQALLECKMIGIDTTELPNFFEREAARIDIDVLRPSWLLFADGFALPTRRTVKRTFDLLLSGTMLAITWPLMLAAAAAIKIEEGVGAPVFYRQSRTGLGGRSFDALKFRSMRIDAERFGEAKFAETDDPRITRTGRFIRRTRIDELPQLLNILRGEMSVVGPRPERPCFVAEFEAEIPFYGERHRVKPGLAGWAQLNYPYGAGADDARRKLEFDLYYVKNYSLLLDLVILIRTFEIVLIGKGVR